MTGSALPKAKAYGTRYNYPAEMEGVKISFLQAQTLKRPRIDQNPHFNFYRAYLRRTCIHGQPYISSQSGRSRNQKRYNVPSGVQDSRRVIGYNLKGYKLKLSSARRGSYFFPNKKFLCVFCRSLARRYRDYKFSAKLRGIATDVTRVKPRWNCCIILQARTKRGIEY
uniref:Uncharacterized protein n=1 Tax=Candidatus Kentrum sp. LFY TaxID=2126342 RepID=A0A450U537_9GAMM|nr:MAG: hypothetical protein BECKLFY1418B_GA0070995_100242 [Candidatus Kentron sp. LFY]